MLDGGGYSLNETEPAGSSLNPIQTHDDTLDFPRHREQLVDLSLRSIESEIPDVERRACE